MIRLNRNEIPISFPKRMIKAIKNSIDELNRYAFPSNVEKLLHLLSDYTKCPKEAIILSTASDILLKEFIYLFANKRQILMAEPSFFLIEATSRKMNSLILKVKLKKPHFKFPIDSIIEYLKKPTLAILDNPNNPTGSLMLDESDVLEIIENKNVILLIDEAYYEFSRASFVHLITEYPNLAILRTLSKGFGLAGLGIGYLIGGEQIIHRFEGISTMLSNPNVIAGINALNHRKYFERKVKEIIEEKERVINEIKELKLKITIFPTSTNFILINTNLPDIVEKLEALGILVLDVSSQFGPGYIRVTIGTRKENDYFISALKKILV